MLHAVTATLSVDKKTVALTGYTEAITDDASIFAAHYEDGKMKTVLKGNFTSSAMKVVFSQELAIGWTIFFLGSREHTPLCPS